MSELVRCAVYTRKSSEEGLDQAFNSLDAQREACEAYIKSQAHEGWRAVRDRYDDGGVSGGTMERPALQRLLADIDAGLIDTIVVYKIDRLTRSLADFARIVERLERRGASFVSVTQSFNTTTSMGRLTLNVLLSFAQFEREVTGERIRDKIAASKRRGMWMGGMPPLGYDPPTDKLNRGLTLNEAEAETVRAIFQKYLDLGSVSALGVALEAEGVRSKAWIAKSGQPRGGGVPGRGALYHLLQNRLYLGETCHGEASYPGQHPAIVSVELFDAVQAKLRSQRHERHERPTRVSKAPLVGLLFDQAGRPMSPTFCRRPAGQYRYYTSAPLQQGVAKRGGGLRRLSAPAFEDGLRIRLAEALGRPTEASLVELIGPVVRIDLAPDGVVVQLRLLDLPGHQRRKLPVHPTNPSLAELHIAMACKVRGGRTWVTGAQGAAPVANPDRVLIKGLRQAHQLAARLGWRMSDGTLARLDAEAPKSGYERRLIGLAFLAPDIQAAIIDGRQAQGLTLEHLTRQEIPLKWADQRKMVEKARA